MNTRAPPIGNGASIDRMILSAVVIADGNGKASFTFGPAALSEVLEGILQAPGVSPAAQFTASIGATAWGTWNGPTNYGPIQLWSGESITVAAQGLTPNTQNTLTFTGRRLPMALASPVPPAAPLSTVAVETTMLLYNSGLVAAAGPFANVTAPPPTRRATIWVAYTNTGVAGSGAISVTVTGVQTGTVYYNNASAFLRPALNNTNILLDFFAIEPLVDSQYLVALGGVGLVGTDSVQIKLIGSVTNPLAEIYPQPGAVFTVTPSGTVTVAGSVTAQPKGGTANKTLIGLIAASTTNQVLIVAPGLGLSTYVQTIQVMVTGSTAPGQITIAAGNNGFTTDFFSTILNTGTDKFAVSFPEGFEVGNNVAVTVTTNAMGATCNVIVTYSTAAA